MPCAQKDAGGAGGGESLCSCYKIKMKVFLFKQRRKHYLAPKPMFLRNNWYNTINSIGTINSINSVARCVHIVGTVYLS